MRKHLLLIMLIALSSIATGSLSSAVRAIDNSSQKSDFSDLTLEIATAKEEFNQLEPIPLALTLSNKTDETITASTALNFDYHFLTLFVRLPGGERQMIERLSMLQKFVGVGSGKIKPSQTTQLKQLVDIELDKIFPYPGEYQLQAELMDGDSKKVIKSNHLRIRIMEPQGLDRQAFDFIKKNGNPSYFLNGYERVVDKKPLSILEEFVSRFGETAYGDYATFQLGEVYFYGKDYEKAIKHLEKLANKPDFVFSERVKEYLSRGKEKVKHQKP